MKKIILLLLVTVAFAQSPQRGTYGPIAQGGTIQIPNNAGSQALSFEYLYSATPASASITIQGCMRGSNGQPGQVGTCDAAVDTYTGTSNSIRSPSFTKVYDTFLITAGTLSGATLTVNTTVVVSKAGTGGGGSGTISGTLATGGNPGPVPYVSAANTLSEDASNFCWDATAHHMGIGTCSPGAGNSIDVQVNGSSSLTIFNGRNSGAGGTQINMTTPAGAATFGIMNSTGSDLTNGIARAGFIAGAPLQFSGDNTTARMTMQTNGHTMLNTTTDPGANIWLTVNGDLKNTHKIAGGTAPTIASGAGTGATIAGADESGTITVGTTPGNSIVVTLGQAYTNVPTCSATDTSSSPVFVQCVGATGTLTLNGISFSTGAAANFTANHVITWIVGGH